MGMLLYDALVLAAVSSRIESRKRVLTLGVPTLNFGAAEFWSQAAARPECVKNVPGFGAAFSTHKEFFHALGFSDVDALDISAYEGANIIGDLNDHDLRSKLQGSYDLIYDSGTIEHIFDITTALRTIESLLKVGGAVVHATPSNGFLDHGFWQVSPDLFRFFYGEPAYRCLTSALFVLCSRPYSIVAADNLYRTRGRGFIVREAPAAIAVFAALKARERAVFSIGLQDYYSEMHGQDKTGFGMDFYIAMGSAFWGRASRYRLVEYGLRMRGMVRRVARGLFKRK